MGANFRTNHTLGWRGGLLKPQRCSTPPKVMEGASFVKISSLLSIVHLPRGKVHGELSLFVWSACLASGLCICNRYVSFILSQGLLVQNTQSPSDRQCILCERKKTKSKSFRAFIEQLLTRMMLSSSFWDTGSAVLALLPSVSRPAFPQLLSACLLFCSLLLTCVNRWSIQRQWLHSGGQSPGYLYSADKCVQPCWSLFGQQTIGHHTIGVCSLFLLPFSLPFTCLLLPSLTWVSKNTCLTQIYCTLLTKLFQTLKQRLKNVSCWASHFLLSIYGHDSLL